MQYCDNNFTFFYINFRRYFQWTSIYYLALLPLVLAGRIFDYPWGCTITDVKRANESLFTCMRRGLNIIETLTIRDNDLTMLSDVIEQWPSVKYIEIRDLNLSSIDSVRIRDCSRLDMIDVSENKFRKLPSDLLANCQNLRVLSLAKNEIADLPFDTFSVLPLEVLSLAHNQIAVLDINIFRSLTNLNELDLSHNRLQIIDSGLLQCNRKIWKLNLSHNNIERVQPKSFWMLDNLRKLEIGYNSKLSDLDLTHMNKLFRVYVDNASLETLFIPSSVVSLRAVNNRISNITIDNEKNNFLDDLVLYNNSITALNFTNVSRLNKLRILQLHFNPIPRKSIDIVEISKTLPSLEGLSISFDDVNVADELLQEAEKNHMRFGVSSNIVPRNFTTLLFENFDAKETAFRYTSLVGGDEQFRNTWPEYIQYYY